MAVTKRPYVAEGVDPTAVQNQISPANSIDVAPPQPQAVLVVSLTTPGAPTPSDLMDLDSAMAMQGWVPATASSDRRSRIRAFRSTALATPGIGIPALIGWNAESVRITKTNIEHSNTVNPEKIVITQKAIYQVNVGVTLAGSPATRVRLLVNGAVHDSVVVPGAAAATLQVTATLSKLLELTEKDVITADFTSLVTGPAHVQVDENHTWIEVVVI
jgi:hypothetical protein